MNKPAIPAPAKVERDVIMPTIIDESKGALHKECSYINNVLARDVII